MKTLNIIQCKEGIPFKVESFIVDESYPIEVTLDIAYTILEKCGNNILQAVRDKGLYVDYEFSEQISKEQFISDMKRNINVFCKTIDNLYSISVLYSS